MKTKQRYLQIIYFMVGSIITQSLALEMACQICYFQTTTQERELHPWVDLGCVQSTTTILHVAIKSAILHVEL